MMKKVLLIVFIFSFQFGISQVEDAWVYFKDKPSEATYFDNPSLMLTQRALDRRTKYAIALDTKDVPIEPSYVTFINSASGITIKARSKWLNAIHIQGSQITIEGLKMLSYVDHIEYANRSLNTGKTSIKNKVKSKKKIFETTTDFNYGNAANQVQMMNVDYLHQQNYTGNGMIIAVIDAGFPGVNSFSAFERIRVNNQILGGYDFVNRSTNFYQGNSHGMSVLSDIAGYVDGQFVGTAPDAQFYLFITEDGPNEIRLEESLWVEAAERADSLGVDVINTSLGYADFFDNDDHDYEYADMDGKTAFITRGAEIAFSRGMILVNAAGNEGDDPWKYINAPADSESILSVGAVNSAGVIASFSSYGPTADGRLKPDVDAQGSGVYVINSFGNIGTSGGTSFASPIMAGAVTCLWQAFPEMTNAQITQMVKQSAHLYGNPNNHEGYGIPNFQEAFRLLDVPKNNINNRFHIYPNPATDFFQVDFDSETLAINIYDILGKKVLNKTITKKNPQVQISQLSKGIYIVELNDNGRAQSFKLIKR